MNQQPSLKKLLLSNQSEESKTIKAAEPVEILPEPLTVGDIFNYFYKKGCKSMPVGIQINAENWKGNIYGNN
jgi:hypothetical protein